jgi:Flp pilus assembly protein TadD
LSTAAANNSGLTEEQTEVSKLLKFGQQYCSQHNYRAAIDAIQAGLALARGDEFHRAPDEMLAQLCATLANAWMALGQAELAAVNYKAALRLSPHLAGCWCNLGAAHMQQGKADEAVAYFLQAIELNPGHWPSRTNLVQALIATRQYLTAKTLLLELIDERPEHGRLHHDLGRACFELDEKELALCHFREASVLDPKNAESLYWIGALSQSAGDMVAAQSAYRYAAEIQPLIRRPAVKTPAKFKVLALYSPFGGNTPTQYLFADANYETDTLSLLPSTDIDALSLGCDYGVVVNLISDADQATDVLVAANSLVGRLGSSIINHPRSVLRTTRDVTSQMFSGIPACRVPKTLRLKADGDFSRSLPQIMSGLSFPILVRPAGTHGGERFEKVDDIATLVDLIEERSELDHYLIEYIDYRSVDGYFRKYRFVFVAGEIFPYHLAIGADWKLHRDSVDMRGQGWMREEEALFVSCPGRFFEDHHLEALKTIGDRIGLEYFGVDCGLDALGNLVVFEANASVLVHGEEGELAYKDAFVKRIREAFNAMLARHAAASV